MRFTVFLRGEHLKKQFSEISPDEQMVLVSRYNAREIPENRFKIPRMFISLKRQLYKNWNMWFEAKNVIQQIWAKAIEVDIIFLQQVNAETFDELKKQFECVYSIIPK